MQKTLKFILFVDLKSVVGANFVTKGRSLKIVLKRTSFEERVELLQTTVVMPISFRKNLRIAKVRKMRVEG